jgi:pimeloyl-ACP methyl ester carboxylesterase
MWTPQIGGFCRDYRVIVPALDGHDLEHDSTFTSVRQSAQDILNYLEENYAGKVFAVCGASLGATIAADLLVRKPALARKAILDGAPLTPYGNVFVEFIKWYRWKQTRFMGRGGPWVRRLLRQSHYPEYLIDDVVQVCSRMNKATCDHANHSAFCYTLPPAAQAVQAEVMYWYGSREAFFTRNSAKVAAHSFPRSRRVVFPGYNHGELCIGHSKEYIRRAKEFFQVPIEKCYSD